MNKIKFLFVGAVFGMVGCTDTIDTITREYRNTTNEAIDALMMVNDEYSARRYTVRVFSQLDARYASIDNRLKIVETNRSKKEFVKEVFESNGFHLYCTEVDINRQRYGMELTRLRGVLADYTKEERARLDEEGQVDVPINYGEICPILKELVDDKMKIVGDQLLKPKLFEKMRNFKDWKVEGYDKLLKEFQKKREAFNPKDPNDPTRMKYDVNLLN